LIDNNCYEKALIPLNQAMAQRDKDQRYAKTYGHHFIDYFPHREKGISLLYLGYLQKAFHELSLSYKQFPSEKAKYYLDQIKREEYKIQGIVPTQPVIHVNGLDHDGSMLTRNYPLTLSGFVSDPQYVHKILINNHPVFQEKSDIDVPFSHELPLTEGLHHIHFFAENLNKGKSMQTIAVQVDRTGPTVYLLSHPSHSSITACADDPSGIRRLVVNNQSIEYHGKHKIYFQLKYPTMIEDMAGNQTQIDPSHLFAQSSYPYLATNSTMMTDQTHSLLKNQPINIYVSYWQTEDYAFLPEIIVQGYVYAKHGLKRLYCNHDLMAQDNQPYIFFSKTIRLKPGYNEIEIQAVDQKDQEKTYQFHVKRLIPETQKIDHRYRLAVNRLETYNTPVDTKNYTNLMLINLVKTNRFMLIPRDDSLIKINLPDNHPSEAHAMLIGHVIKTKKDLEIAIKMVDSQNSTILCLADVHAPHMTSQNLDFLLQRLVHKIEKEFPLINGHVFQKQQNTYYVRYEMMRNFIDWPVLLYTNKSPDSIRGTDHIIIDHAKVVQYSKDSFCVKGTYLEDIPSNDINVIFQ